MRLLGYFVLVLATMFLLRLVPWIGGLFAIPWLGFLLAAGLVSAVLSFTTVRALDRRRARALERQLGAVDTPHNQGKLGSLVLAQGRAKAAVAHLERAVAGEPDHAEWSYRLGCAYLRAGRPADARTALRHAAAIAEEHAFGAVTLRLSQAELEAGDATRALEALALHERNHGPSPESAYRRALALRGVGRRDEARAALAEVPALAARSASFQRREQQRWVWASYLRRFV